MKRKADLKFVLAHAHTPHCRALPCV